MKHRPAHRFVEEQIEAYTGLLECVKGFDQKLDEADSAMLREAVAINRRLQDSIETALRETCKLYSQCSQDARL